MICYVLAMIQLGSRAWFPDLLLLLVLTAAVFEDRSFALVTGLLAGLFVDAGNPSLLGTNMTAYLLIAYGVTFVRRLVYEHVGYLFVFGALALIIRHGIQFAMGQGSPVWWHVVIGSAVTLALLVPVYRLIKLVFKYQWKTA